MAAWETFYSMWDSDEARSLLAVPLPVEAPEKTSSLSQLFLNKDPKDPKELPQAPCEGGS